MPRPIASALADKLRRVLADRRIVRWAAMLATLIVLPVVFQGLQVDDHWMRIHYLRVPPWSRVLKPPIEMFVFFDGDAQRTGWLIDRGWGAWWSDPEIRVAFLRPLTALTHWLDFRLWPGSPWLMHAQSVAWYAALVACAAALYRRVLGGKATPAWIAGFSAVIYAVDNTHGMVAEWISNRSALIAATFGMLSLLLHDRARRDGRALFSALSALALALGLLAGEVALGATAYLAAHAAFLDEAPLRARLRGLAPHIAILAAWVVVYRVGGFGVHGSGLYVDPGRDPARFLAAAATNVPLLLASELGALAPDPVVFLPPVFLTSAVIAALVFITAAALAFAPLLRDPPGAQPEGRAKIARFFLAGALLATLPSAATFPAARLMLLPGFGLLGLIALVVGGVVERTYPFPRRLRVIVLGFAVWVGGGHLFLSPLAAQAATFQIELLDRVIRRLADGLPDDPSLARQRVIVVNAPDATFTGYVPWVRATEGRVAPRALTLIAVGTRGLEIERPDASTLVARPDDGFYRRGTDLLARSLTAPMPVGTRVDLSDLTVEVTKTDAHGVPTEAAFHFASPLESDTLRWVEWRAGRFVPFTLPPIGGRLRIEAQPPTL